VRFRAGGREVGDLDAVAADLLRREGEGVEAGDDLGPVAVGARAARAATGGGRERYDRRQYENDSRYHGC
jgi:hypothetical protein